MADGLMKFEHDGRTYQVDAQDLTIRRLRQLKSWFGKEYGAYLPLVGLVSQFDADAIAAMIWIGRDKAGEQGLDARNIDYIPADLAKMQGDDTPDDDEPAQEESPTVASLPLTDASAHTSSTTSEADTSSTSETSSD